MRLKTNVDLTIDTRLQGIYTGKITAVVTNVYFGNDFLHQQIGYKIETLDGFTLENSVLNLENGEVIYGTSKESYYDLLKAFIAVRYSLSLSQIDLELS